jgi:hypothetical protein
MKLDVTSAECIKSTGDFLTTKYTNICNGDIVIVQNGNLDMVFAFALTVFMVVVILAFLRVIFD